MNKLQKSKPKNKDKNTDNFLLSQLHLKNLNKNAKKQVNNFHVNRIQKRKLKFSKSKSLRFNENTQSNSNTETIKTNFCTKNKILNYMKHKSNSTTTKINNYKNNSNSNLNSKHNSIGRNIFLKKINETFSQECIKMIARKKSEKILAQKKIPNRQNNNNSLSFGFKMKKFFTNIKTKSSSKKRIESISKFQIDSNNNNNNNNNQEKIECKDQQLLQKMKNQSPSLKAFLLYKNQLIKNKKKLKEEISKNNNECNTKENISFYKKYKNTMDFRAKHEIFPAKKSNLNKLYKNYCFLGEKNVKKDKNMYMIQKLRTFKTFNNKKSGSQITYKKTVTIKLNQDHIDDSIENIKLNNNIYVCTQNTVSNTNTQKNQTHSLDNKTKKSNYIYKNIEKEDSEDEIKFFDISKINFSQNENNNISQIPKEYLNIIYYNLLLEEKESIEKMSPKPIYTYMKEQPEINEQMRSILIDWIIDVHEKFGFTDETLFMTILIIDRYSTQNNISKIKYQLLGIVAMLIACKHEEIYVPKIDDFIYITDNTYTRDEVFDMENKVLNCLNFSLLYPSPIKFFEYLSLNFGFDKKMHFLGKYLMESFLLDMRYMKYKASIIACACCYIVMKFFKKDNYKKSYNKKYYTLPNKDDDKSKNNEKEFSVKDCAQDICLFVDNVDEGGFLSCKKKYSKDEYEKVSVLINKIN